MGLLDEAIREHLELKRRRGADPEEVAKQEDEALGAPQRGEFAQPAEAEAEADAEPEPAGEAVEDQPEEAEDWIAETGAEPAPAPFDAEAPAAAPETAELGEEPPPADEADAKDEDVLEATPDFLEETPDHDRLWFEQKPPKDFDFDS